MTDAPTPKSPGLIARMARSRPTRPGEIYGVPGHGNTFWLSVASVAAMLFVWWLVTALGLVKPLFVPAPQLVVEKFFQIWSEGFTNTSFLAHIFISTARVFGAFLLACVIGLPLGLAMGMSPLIRGIFDPPIEFYRPIPPLAYLPLMIIWFGIGETSKVLLIFLSVFAPIVLGARSGVKSAAIGSSRAACSWATRAWSRRPTSTRWPPAAAST